MSNSNHKPKNTFSRAWEIISQDTTIPLEEKKSVLKLIQVLLESKENSTSKNRDDEALSITQEIISKHSLMATVKHQADELDSAHDVLFKRKKDDSGLTPKYETPNLSI